MTNEEAIKTIKIAMSEVEWNYPMDYSIAFEKAIFAIDKQIKLENALALINRQKAEIEELRKGFTADADYFASEYDKNIKAEAIKEFAHFVIDRSRNGVIYASDIPDLVKEMTEGKNE